MAFFSSSTTECLTEAMEGRKGLFWVAVSEGLQILPGKKAKRQELSSQQWKCVVKAAPNTADQRRTRHKSSLLPPPTHLTVLARPRFLKVPQPSKQHHKLGTESPKHKPIGDTPDSIMAPPHPFRPSSSALDPQGRKVPGLWLILVISSLSCPSSFPSQTFYSSCKALAQTLPLSATDFSCLERAKNTSLLLGV